MNEHAKSLSVVLEPCGRKRKPVTIHLDEMLSLSLRDGGAVFLSPFQGWRAHFHTDEARLQSKAEGSGCVERVSHISAVSRRTQDDWTTVDAWLLDPGASAVISPVNADDRFMYRGRVFPRMTIKVA